MAQFGSAEPDVVRGVAPAGTSTSHGHFVAGSTRGILGSASLGGSDAFLARIGWSGESIWVRQFGSAQDDFGLALSSDGSGGAYIAGYTTGDMGGGGYAGWHDAFVARYDLNGNRVWIRQFGTPQSDIARAVIRDGMGGVFVAGNTAGSLGGPTGGSNDAFVARYDGAGNQLWITQFGGSGSEIARALAPDFGGGVYVAGDVYEDPFGLNVFLARYDSAGNQLWLRQFGSSGADYGYALAEDDFGGVYIGGRTSGDLGGPNAGGNDAWLARYDSTGTRLWITQFGTPEWDEIFAMEPGDSGVLVAGGTEGALSGSGGGVSDAFVASFDGSGDLEWIRQFGSGAPDGATAISYGVVAGYTDGTVGAASTGTRDVFVVHLRQIIFCYANCDNSYMSPPILSVDDFTCFIDEFASAMNLPHHQQIHHYANCDGSTTAPVLTVDDFTCFINAFAAGCP